MNNTTEQVNNVDLSNGATETFTETWRVGTVPEFESSEIFAAEWGSELYERISPIATYKATFAGWYPGTDQEWALSRRDAVVAYHSEHA